MGKPRKPPQPFTPAHQLKLVPASPRPSWSALGIDEAAANELKELIRSINQRRKPTHAPTDDGELPPAA